MKKEREKIKVISYVHYQGQLVEFKDLPPEVRERAARELRKRYFNALFAGQATFFYEDEVNAAQAGGKAVS